MRVKGAVTAFAAGIVVGVVPSALATPIAHYQGVPHAPAPAMLTVSTRELGSTTLPGVQVPIAGDRHAQIPWKLTVSGANIGSSHVPGICVTFLWAWGPGQPIGNGFPYCIAPATGHFTPHGTVFSFNLDSFNFGGVAPYGAGSAGTIRGIVVLAVPQARRVRAVLLDGDVLSMQAHPLPAQVHRAASIAYSVKIYPRTFSTQFRSVTAYGANGAVVGHSK